MTHKLSVRHWRVPRQTFRAECSCGWVAEFGHNRRLPAHEDALMHQRLHRVALRSGSPWDDHWLPGV